MCWLAATRKEVANAHLLLASQPDSLMESGGRTCGGPQGAGPGRRANPRGGAGRPAGPRTEDELRRLAHRGHLAGQRPVLTPPHNCSTLTIDKVAHAAP